MSSNPDYMYEQQRRAMQEAAANQQRACMQPTPGMQEMLDQMGDAKPLTMIEAFGVVVEALEPLHEEARLRVLRATAIILGVKLGALE